MIMHMKDTIVGFCWLFVLAVCVIGCGSDKGSDPPDKPDKSRIWIDSVDAVAGDRVRVDVHAVLKSPLQGLQLPLKLTGTDAGVDSVTVSFIGTILEKRPLLSYIDIDDSSSATETTISIIRAYTPSQFIEPDSGVFMSIYVALSESAELRTIPIDTTTVGRNSLQFADTADVGSVPLFTPGAIEILAPEQ